MPTAAVDSQTHSNLGVVAAGIAVSAWGLAGVVAKSIDMGGVAIGAYRFAVYGVIVALAMGLRGNPLSLHALRSSFAGGMALGLDVAFFFSAVKETTIANATVIGALQPVVIAILAARLFGERIHPRDALLGILALLGVIVVVSGARSSDEASLLGDSFAVGALFSWSAYFVFSKQATRVITPNEYTVGAALWAGLFNIPVALAFGQSLGWPTIESWVGLLVLALGAGLLGHSLMNWSIQQIPLWLGSTFTLLIPVVSAGAAWVFLDEPLTAIQIGAMALVLVALAGIVRNQGRIRSNAGAFRPFRR